MEALLRTQMLALLVVLFIPYLAGAQSETQLRMPGPETQNLMLGTWSIKLQYEPNKDMPKGNVAFGEEKWYPGPGGLSLVEEYREINSTGEISGLGISWWDEKVKGYRVVWCESTNPGGCMVPNGIARWEGGQLTLSAEEEQGGKKMTFKEVFSQITPMAFKQALYTGESGSDLKLLVTIRATRKTTSK